LAPDDDRLALECEQISIDPFIKIVGRGKNLNEKPARKLADASYFLAGSKKPRPRDPG